jgi:hypothetical protein
MSRHFNKITEGREIVIIAATMPFLIDTLRRVA